MIKSFQVTNFLRINDQLFIFDNLSNLNEEGVKAFFILKYLITLSEQMPSLVTLIDNEIRPNPLEPVQFKVNIEYQENDYQYLIQIKDGKIAFEQYSLNSKVIFTRTKMGIILKDEPITWNCPNQTHKVFLDACATKENVENGLCFFFKENILGLTNYLKNPLNDDIIKLFNNDNTSLSPILKDIIIYDEIYTYGDDIQLLNNILSKNHFALPPFKNLHDLDCRIFLKLNINLAWLELIGGGTLFLDDSYRKYQAYLENYLLIHPSIQVIYQTFES